MSMTAINATTTEAQQLGQLGERTRKRLPIQNLPFCAFRRARSAEHFRGGVAIGDSVLVWARCMAWASSTARRGCTRRLCPSPGSECVHGLGAQASAALRAALSSALRTDSALASHCARGSFRRTPRSTASRAGGATSPTSTPRSITPPPWRLFAPDNPLLRITVAADRVPRPRSSIRVSGYDFARPMGQVLPAGGRAAGARRHGGGWITSWKWAYSSGVGTSSTAAYRWRTRRRICLWTVPAE